MSKALDAIDQLRGIVRKLTDLERVLRDLDDTPHDEPDDRVFTNLNHNEATNRIRVVVDCHLSRAPAVMAALASNCENLATHYLPPQLPPPPADAEIMREIETFTPPDESE